MDFIKAFVASLFLIPHLALANFEVKADFIQRFPEKLIVPQTGGGDCHVSKAFPRFRSIRIKIDEDKSSGTQVALYKFDVVNTLEIKLKSGSKEVKIKPTKEGSFIYTETSLFSEARSQLDLELMAEGDFSAKYKSFLSIKNKRIELVPQQVSDAFNMYCLSEIQKENTKK